MKKIVKIMIIILGISKVFASNTYKQFGVVSLDQIFNDNYTSIKIDINQLIHKRWWSIDPKANKFPSQSPYNFVENNPIQNVDPDGRNAVAFFKGKSKNGNDLLIVKANYYYLKESLDENAIQMVNKGLNNGKPYENINYQGRKIDVQFEINFILDESITSDIQLLTKYADNPSKNFEDNVLLNSKFGTFEENTNDIGDGNFVVIAYYKQKIANKLNESFKEDFINKNDVLSEKSIQEYCGVTILHEITHNLGLPDNIFNDVNKQGATYSLIRSERKKNEILISITPNFRSLSSSSVQKMIDQISTNPDMIKQDGIGQNNEGVILLHNK